MKGCRLVALGFIAVTATFSQSINAESPARSRGTPYRIAESCHDGRTNGPESDVDCGGDCPACKVDQLCGGQGDCESGLCVQGTCQERLHDSSSAVPPGYELARAQDDAGATVRKSGILFLTVGYGAAYAGAVSYPHELAWLYAPLIGPWLALGHTDREALRLGLIADGVIQAGGAILLVGGLAATGMRLIKTPKTEVQLVPHSNKTGFGFGLQGSFF